jgi:hypothetical protein
MIVIPAGSGPGSHGTDQTLRHELRSKLKPRAAFLLRALAVADETKLSFTVFTPTKPRHPSQNCSLLV